MKRLVKTAIGVMAVALWMPAASTEGRLQVGNPVIEAETVTFPVLLDGDVGGGVSSMDFVVKYDATVFEPVNAVAGSAATAASKNVESNVRTPGDFKVLVMGLNQNTVTDGEVAQIVLRKIDPNADTSNLRLTQTTFASPEGTEIPSRGSSRNIDFAGDNTDEPVADEEAEEETEEQPADSNETSPANTGAGDTNTQSGTPASTLDSDSPQPTSSEAGSTSPAGSPLAQSRAPGASDSAKAAAARGERLAQTVQTASAARSAVTAPSAGGAATSNKGADAAGSASPGSAPQPLAATESDDAGSGYVAPVAEAAVGEAPSPTQVARAVPAGVEAQAAAELTESGGEAATPATAAESPATASSATKLISIVLIGAVVLGVLFFVRKKLFA